MLLMCLSHKVLKFLQKYLQQFRIIMVIYLYKPLRQHPMNMKSHKYFYQSKQRDIKTVISLSF